MAGGRKEGRWGWKEEEMKVDWVGKKEGSKENWFGQKERRK